MDYEMGYREEFLGGVEKVTIRRQPNGKQTFNSNWFQLIESGLCLVEGLTQSQGQLWWWLVRRMNVANMVFEVKAKEIAGELRVSEANLSRAMAQLRKSGLVRGRYMISPRVVYKGQTADYADVVDRWNQLEK